MELGKGISLKNNKNSNSIRLVSLRDTPFFPEIEPVSGQKRGNEREPKNMV